MNKKLLHMKRVLLLSMVLLGLLTGCKDREKGIEPVVDSATITAEGGVYNLKNGVSITVPAGAVNQDTEIEVEYFNNLSATSINSPVPGDIQGGIHFSPEGLVFNHPLQVRMKSALPLDNGDTTTIMLWAPDEKAFYITDFGIYRDGGINFTVEHFSHYISMDNEWQALFDLFDGYVNLYMTEGGATEQQLNDGCDRFLKKCLDEDLDFKDLKAVETFEGGSSKVACLTTCGYTGIYYYQAAGASTLKGEAHYKGHSDIQYTLHMFNKYATEHMKDEKGASSSAIRGRSIYIFLQPCQFDLDGNADKSTIKKNETTTVHFQATCDGSPLPGHKVKFNYVGDIKIDKDNAITDDNGQVSVRVTGLASEGIAAVIATATSAADPSITVDCQVEILLDDSQPVDRYQTDIEEIIQITARPNHYADISVKTSIKWHQQDGKYIYDDVRIVSVTPLTQIPDSVEEYTNSTANGSYNKRAHTINTHIEPMSGGYSLNVADDTYKTITNAPIGFTVLTTDYDQEDTEWVTSKYWRKVTYNVTTYTKYTTGDRLMLLKSEGTQVYDKLNSANETTGVCYGICGFTVKGQTTVSELKYISCSNEYENVDQSDSYEYYETGTTIYSKATTKKVSK